MKNSLPDPDDLIALYASGKGLTQLASIFHADTRTIKGIIIANGGKLRKRGESVPQPFPEWFDTAVNRYQKGEGLNSLAKEYHVASTTLKKWLQERNIPIRDFAEGAKIAIEAKSPEWWEERNKKCADIQFARSHLPTEEIAQRYIAGESEKSLAESYNVSRRSITTHLRHANVQRRTASEANILMAASMTPEQRSQRVKSAQDAVRGSKRPFEELCKRAQIKQERLTHVSPLEKQVSLWLKEMGLNVIPQLAIGPYNADIVIGPVAVEIFGGAWHAYGSHVLRAGKRLRYFLDQGWNLIFVWIDSAKWPLTIDSAKYISAFHQIACIDPSIRGQYRVIGGNGYEMPEGSFYFNKATGI